MELTTPDVDNWVCTVVVVGFEKMYDSRSTTGGLWPLPNVVPNNCQIFLLDISADCMSKYAGLLAAQKAIV